MQTASLKAKPTGLLRFLFKAPVSLYRWHLGWLLGHRFLLLTHRGRKTGLARRTVLEVLHYDPATRESVVLAGLGAGADWYRNIRAQPAVEVRTGRLRYAPRHRLLSPDEAATVAARFAREHPWEARIAPAVLRRLGWSAAAPSASWRDVAAEFPLVAFRPRD